MTGSPILNLFSDEKLVNVCAPMVRYSKLAFRTLVRRYNCHLCFTPMILADSFITSERARQSEFTTNKGDTPLIVQFASNDPCQFADAAEMVAGYSDGVDLNCGCPQRWALADGYGARLLQTPQLIRDMVLQVRNRIPWPFTVSVKIRIQDNLRQSVELCKMLESTGVSFVTVHGRTPKQRHQPVNVDALREIKNSIQVPLIANGDVKSLEDAEYLQKLTGCDGVMAARGILANPAMFAGHAITPLECVQDWIAIASATNMPFQCFHHHLIFMLEKVLPKPKRLLFNVLKKWDVVLDFLADCGIKCNKSEYDVDSFSALDLTYRNSKAYEKLLVSLDNDVDNDLGLNEMFSL